MAKLVNMYDGSWEARAGSRGGAWLALRWANGELYPQAVCVVESTP
jgi:hypothetical protein